MGNFHGGIIGDLLELINIVLHPVATLEVLNEIRQIFPGLPMSGGHGMYPFQPPPNDPQNGLTSYQIAANYINDTGKAVIESEATHFVFVNETEVLTVNFTTPSLVSAIGFDVTRSSMLVELWYQDVHNNWMQVLDEVRNPVTLQMSASTMATWYTAIYAIYPILTKALQFRFTRIPDPAVGTLPYCVGMRNALIERQIYRRTDGTLAIGTQQDPLGNTITSYVQDWDASQAIDDNPNTYWRSEAMPDPAAVVSMYLDCRAPDGGSQLIDTLYLDPVYTGQNLNVYYSSDDTVGTLKLSPTSCVPTVNENTTWKQGTGLWDIGSNPPVPTGTYGEPGYDPGLSNYEFPMSWGPLVSQDAWIGIEWAPDFDPASGPPENPVLFRVTPTSPVEGQYWPTLYYDVGAGQLVLELFDGVTSRVYAATLEPLFTQYASLNIVVGWTYSPSAIVISVKTATGTELVLNIAYDAVTVAGTSFPTSVPTLMTLDGSIGFVGFRGLFTAHVVKLETWTDSGAAAAFQLNPGVYVSPEPVIPDPNGTIPSTPLDNAIFAAAWEVQQAGTGGSHESAFYNKTWTPVLANYTATKGNLFFPQQYSLKYLQLEFSNLTEEAYPVYDAGIEVAYSVYPASVIASCQPTTNSGTTAGMLAMGGDIVLGSMNAGSVNWLNPSTVNAATNSLYGLTVPPTPIVSGSGTLTTSLPNLSQTDVFSQTRQEVASPWVYKRNAPSAPALAANTITGATTPVIQGLSSSTYSVADNVIEGFTPQTPSPSGRIRLPSRGLDWWVFPGGTLRMPASVMTGLFGRTKTVTAYRPGTDAPRLRFTTTCVHHYAQRTAVRDAAIGYFAGLREVQPYVTSYVDALDPLTFTFTSYDPSQWVLTNVKSLDSGPITTAGSLYIIENPEFDPGWAPFQAALVEDTWEAINVSTGSVQLFATEAEADAFVQASSGQGWEVQLGTPSPLGLQGWTQVQGGWTNDSSNGHWTGGSATITADGTLHQLTSSQMDVTPGTNIDATVWARWTNVTYTAGGASPIQLVGVYYDAHNDIVSTQSVGVIVEGFPYTFPFVLGGWPPFSGPDDSSPWIQLVATQAAETGFTVPDGAVTMSLQLLVGPNAESGQFWFDDVEVGTPDPVIGTAFKDFQTTSTFAKVKLSFQDSGLVRSDSMWARTDPFDTNIGYTALAYYTDTIPDIIPVGNWGDTFGTWGSSVIRWGEPQAVVAIQVDPNRVYQGNRVLHFTRAAGAGEAGVKVRQWTNFVANGLFRIGAVFLKPTANPNQITLRLRRVSDGIYIYQETFTPVAGYWYEHVTDFQEIPDVPDNQIYTVELVCTGDAADELYLSDLYVEIAEIRYLVQLGGEDTFLFDVTQLAHSDNAVVSCTTPVQEVSVEAVIVSPHAYAYGCSITPQYLR